MRTRLLLLLGLASIFCAMTTPFAHGDELYHINLSPPAHVGSTFQYLSSESEIVNSYRTREHITIQQPGESSTITINSNVTIEACDQRGQPSQLKFKVSSLIAPGTGTSFVEWGDQITARMAAVTADPSKAVLVFARGEEPVSPRVAAAMRRVVVLGGPTESTEQQAFGTDKPIPIGGNWALDGEPGARMLAKMRIKVDPKSVTGKAQLLGIDQRGSTANCLKVQMEVHSNDVKPAVGPGETLASAVVTAYATYYIAVDTGRVVESRYQAWIEMKVTGKDGDDPYTDTRWVGVSRDQDLADVPK